MKQTVVNWRWKRMGEGGGGEGGEGGGGGTQGEIVDHQ